MRFALVVAAAAPLVFSIGCNQMQAKKQVASGLDELNAGQFKQAIADFQQAVQLDPSNLEARRHLAAAYKDEMDPAAGPDANRAAARAAEAVYQQILSQQSGDATDMAALASVYVGENDFTSARAWYVKAQQLAPADATVAEGFGAMEWSETDNQDVALRTKLGIDDEAPLAASDADADVKRACMALRAQVSSEVDDAIAQVRKAIDLRPDYADAMASLNLLYREKADLECGQTAQLKADLDTADSWNAKAIAEHKAELARQTAQTGIVLDQ